MRFLDPSSSHFQVDTVVVPESSFAGLNDDELPTAVTSFVDYALRTGEYTPAELPREALIAHHVNLYHGEVQNGGHAQFVSNFGYHEDTWSLIRTGLNLLEQFEAETIFADLQSFAATQPDRLARCYGQYDDIDPHFFSLDDRFNALPPDCVLAALTAWLKTRPWILPIADAAYRTLVDKLVPPHPLCDERRAVRRPAVIAQIAGLLALIKRTVH